MIDSNSIKTEHPLIFKANEKVSNQLFIKKNLKSLEESISKFDEEESIKILKLLVPDLP